MGIQKFCRFNKTLGLLILVFFIISVVATTVCVANIDKISGDYETGYDDGSMTSANPNYPPTNPGGNANYNAGFLDGQKSRVVRTWGESANSWDKKSNWIIGFEEGYAYAKADYDKIYKAGSLAGSADKANGNPMKTMELPVIFTIDPDDYNAGGYYGYWASYVNTYNVAYEKSYQATHRNPNPNTVPAYDSGPKWENLDPTTRDWWPKW